MTITVSIPGLLVSNSTTNLLAFVYIVCSLATIAHSVKLAIIVLLINSPGAL